MVMTDIDEGKRNKDFKIATIVSTVVIIAVAVYLLTKMFTTNPLEGRWEDEDGSMSLTVEPSGEMLVVFSEVGEAADVEVPMEYTMDKEEKTITIRVDEQEAADLADASGGGFTKEILDAAVGAVHTTFGYNIEDDRLILTEREYGEQMIFLKK